MSTQASERFDLKITDVSGKIVHSRSIEVNGEKSVEIDMNEFSNGVYLLVLSDGLGTQTQQIVKQ